MAQEAEQISKKIEQPSWVSNAREVLSLRYGETDKALMDSIDSAISSHDYKFILDELKKLSQILKEEEEEKAKNNFSFDLLESKDNLRSIPPQIDETEEPEESHVVRIKNVEDIEKANTSVIEKVKGPEVPINTEVKFNIKEENLPEKANEQEKGIEEIRTSIDSIDSTRERSIDEGRLFKELAERELQLHSLWEKILKGKSLTAKLHLKKDNTPEIVNEYKNAKIEYETLKAKVIDDLKIGQEELEGEILSRKEKIGEMESNFSRERAEEYLVYTRKFIRYQKEALSQEKQVLFEKIENLARNKKTQLIIGMAMVGVSLWAPPTGFISLVTGGTWSGFLPASLGPIAKGVGGIAGIGIAALRKRNNKMVEDSLQDDDSFSDDKEITFARNNNFPASNVSFLKLQGKSLRDNFLQIKKNIKEA